jgi:hypothetical protein
MTLDGVCTIEVAVNIHYYSSTSLLVSRRAVQNATHATALSSGRTASTGFAANSNGDFTGWLNTAEVETYLEAAAGVLLFVGYLLLLDRYDAKGNLTFDRFDASS